MTKKVNIQSITETKTTIITVTTTTELSPVTYMPITPSQEPGSEQFYKDNGGKVRKMNKFGKYRTYAIIPVEGYEDASDEEKKALKIRAESFNCAIDNHRRNMARATENYLDHEVTILSPMMDCGYDPSIDSDKPLLDVLKRLDDADKDDKDLSNYTDGLDSLENLDIENSDFDDCSGKNGAIHYSYNSSTDVNNPEYIVAKNILYSKMYAMIDELDGEDLEIVKMIMTGSSERQLARDLGIKPSTLQYHREKLMARFRDFLKDDYRN